MARDRIPSQVLFEGWKILGKHAHNRKASSQTRVIKCIDGTGFSTADTKENEKVFGRPSASRGKTGFPQFRAVLLMDAHSRIFEGIEWGHYKDQSEASLADKLIQTHDLSGTMIEGDRLYFSKKRCYTIIEKKADFLFRIRKDIQVHTCLRLRDGSAIGLLFMRRNSKKLKERMKQKYSSFSLPEIIQEQKRLLKNVKKRRREKRPGHRRSRYQTPACYFVRLIEYNVYVHGPSKSKQESYRLVTSILDPEQLPALTAADDYHCRWEEEVAIREMKWLQNFSMPHFWGKNPARVIQELAVLLVIHTLFRCLLLEASLQSGLPPRRFSVSHARHTLFNALSHSPFSHKNKHICSSNSFIEHLIRHKLPVNSPRECPRALKVPIRRYPSRARVRGPPSVAISYEVRFAPVIS